jgi:hypothetical protein
MRKRGWDKDFRGLAIFDLFAGLFVPFLLVVSCVVIAGGAQFHRSPDAPVEAAVLAKRAQFEYDRTAGAAGATANSAGAAAGTFAQLTEAERSARIASVEGSMAESERRVAGMLTRRNALQLANALKPLTGDVVSQYVFGIGVLGMALSTLILHMLITGFCVCEMLGIEARGWPYRLACLLPGLSGAIVPFFWDQAMFWLAVPTSVFGMTLLPIAYLSFSLMMNQKGLMGDNMPTGGKRLLWNGLMAIATGIAICASGWAIWSQVQTKFYGPYVLGIMIAFVVLVIIVQFTRKRPRVRAGQ